MAHRVLLLDCSAEVSQQLLNENFDVTFGSIGFVTGVRRLPHPIYEADVIIYNPTAVKEVNIFHPAAVGQMKGVIRSRDISGPDVGLFLKPLSAHLNAGGILLVFVNHLSVSLNELQTIYDWIPSMPKLVAAYDSKLVIANIESQPFSAPYQPLLDESRIVKPVKLSLDFDCEELLNQEVLVGNLLGKALAGVVKFGEGRLIVLPSYKSNDDIILDFMHRVLPQLAPIQSSKAIVDCYRSHDECELSKLVLEKEKQIADLQAKLDQLRIEEKGLERTRLLTIKSDRVAGLLVNYLERALQEPKYALVHLYKIVETIEELAGGEGKANEKYGCKRERKLIGRIANASYGDERHAPKSADVVKPWSQEEIADCFEAARAIIVSYFDTLFVPTGT